MLAATACAAGFVRGFSGFGAALVFMPVASSLVDPRLAAGTFLLVDYLGALPLAFGALRRCQWKTVLPAAVAALGTVPLGAALLASGEVPVLRWLISLTALALVALLASGLRYRGSPVWLVSVAVGGVAGFSGGLSQIAGPPVVAYWMSGPAPVPVIRANLIAFFFLTSAGAFLAYWWNGVLGTATFVLAAVLLPVMLVATLAGSRLFGLASEPAYRTMALALIAVAAFASMPLLDGIWR